MKNLALEYKRRLVETAAADSGFAIPSGVERKEKRLSDDQPCQEDQLVPSKKRKRSSSEVPTAAGGSHGKS